MNRRFQITAGIAVLILCIFSGCERKDKQQEELLLLPVDEELLSEAASNIPEAKEQPEESSTGEEKVKDTYVVHICGAVESPGVYILDAGSRIYQVIERAGGFCEDADEDYLNQAELLSDGMKLYVPTKEEVEQAGEADNWQKMNNSTDFRPEEALININTAGEELLCTLPGVGSSKAKSIIAYREKNGRFQKIEDIMNVEGIKDGLFQKIKDSITV